MVIKIFLLKNKKISYAKKYQDIKIIIRKTTNN